MLLHEGGRPAGRGCGGGQWPVAILFTAMCRRLMCLAAYLPAYVWPCAGNVAGLGIPVGIAQLLGYATEVCLSAASLACAASVCCLAAGCLSSVKLGWQWHWQRCSSCPGTTPLLSPTPFITHPPCLPAVRPPCRRANPWFQGWERP